MQHMGFRPADEDRGRGCDTSILVNIRKNYPRMRVLHKRCDPLQIVDWKSRNDQVTTYAEIEARHTTGFKADPFEALTDRFPTEALDDMREHYARRPRTSLVLAA
jgi:hypothetical protein